MTTWRITAVVALAAIAAGCGNTPGGLRRPASKEAVECPTPGNSLQYSAEFTPGTTKNPVENLFVTFRRQKPTSTDAAAVLRSCVEAAAKTFRIDYEMMATAWFNDDGPLPLPDGSDNLTFDPKTGLVKTWNEREGNKPTLAARAGYTVESEVNKVQVAPFGTFVTLTVLFERARPPVEIMNVLVAEITAAVATQHPKANTSAYAMLGPTGDRAAQHQIKGISGQFLSAEFEAKTGQIRDQDNRVIGTIK